MGGKPLAPPAPPGAALLTAQEWAALALSWGLSRRQEEVAKLLLEDHLSRKQVAHRMGLSVSATKRHQELLFARLHVKSRVGLATFLAEFLLARRLGHKAGPEGR